MDGKVSTGNSSSSLSCSGQQSVTMTVEKMDPVEVFAAGEKGRGLRVTKEMSAGDVVFAEASFAAVVFDR